MEETASRRAQEFGVKSVAGIGAGVLILAATLVLPPPDGLSEAGWRTLGMALLMASWWAFEAIPIPATALVPLVAVPLLGIGNIQAAAVRYGDPLVFLFLGGFIIAQGMQRWDLHRRVALAITVRAGTRPSTLVLGFMVATAFLSMWISNTATTVMLLPIALSVIMVVAGEEPWQDRSARNFAVALMLGVAYGASIGGLATKIGSPPNGLLAAYAQQHQGIDIAFADWLLIGLPVTLVLLPLAWIVLTRIAFPAPALTDPAHAHEGRKVLRDTLRGLGPLSSAEKRVAAIFFFIAACWIFRRQLQDLPFLANLNDSTIAIFGALLMFLVPAGRAAPGRAMLTWEEAARIPWGVLLLFGGGLSLASAIDKSGLAVWMGNGLAVLEGAPEIVFMFAATVLTIFLTELTSNTATTAAFLPILDALGEGTGVPFAVLAVPSVVAASCAFMLPVATPPNAIVFGSGYVTIAQMMRAGFLLNLVSIVVITGLMTLLVPLVFK
jgi:solute carrier family 13 (sodium-dependent dicarboxylate transporter), member 2/3/5